MGMGEERLEERLTINKEKEYEKYLIVLSKVCKRLERQLKKDYLIFRNLDDHLFLHLNSYNNTFETLLPHIYITNIFVSSTRMVMCNKYACDVTTVMKDIIEYLKTCKTLNTLYEMVSDYTSFKLSDEFSYTNHVITLKLILK
jgi:hypothetical protein